MRNRLRNAPLALLLAVFTGLAGCGHGSPAPGSQPAPPAAAATAQGEGTAVVQIYVPPPKPALRGLRVHSVDVSEIAFVDLRAHHPGSTTDTPAEQNPIPIVDHKATTTMRLTAGHNMIFVARGLDQHGRPIPGAVIKGVSSVARNGTMYLHINAATTPTAEIVETIGLADPVLAFTVNYNKIQALVEHIVGGLSYQWDTATPTTSPSLIDTELIAARLLELKGAMDFTQSPDMVMEPGKVRVHVVHPLTNQPVGNATVTLDDPLSSGAATDANGDATIDGISPGNWQVFAGGTFVPVKVGEAQVLPGGESDALPQPTAYTPQQAASQSVTQTIGTAGGNVEIANRIRLEIPAEALPQNTAITLASFNDDDPTRLTGYRIEPQGLRFNLPVAVVIPYTDAQAAAWGLRTAGANTELYLSQYDTATDGAPKQKLLPFAVDPVAKTLTAVIDGTGSSIVPPRSTTADPVVLALRKPEQLTYALDVTLEFVPFRAMRLTSIAPNPAELDATDAPQTGTFYADLSLVDDSPFDYDKLGVQVKGRLLNPAGQEVTQLTFAPDTKTPLKQRLKATYPSFATRGTWRLADIRVEVAGTGTLVRQVTAQTWSNTQITLLLGELDPTSYLPTSFAVASRVGSTHEFSANFAYVVGPCLTGISVSRINGPPDYLIHIS